MVLCVIRVNVYLVFQHYGIIKFVKLQHCLLDKMFTKYKMCFCKKCKQFTIIDNNNCFICRSPYLTYYSSSLGHFLFEIDRKITVLCG